MERKQSSNQNQQSSKNNSNDSNSSSTDSFDSNSSSSSNYDYISLYMNKRPDFAVGGGGYRGLPRSSTPLFQSPNPDSLFQNTMFGLNRLSINSFNHTGPNRNSFYRNRLGNMSAFIGENSSNNIIIGDNRLQSIHGGAGLDWNNSVQNRMPNNEIRENLMEGCDFVSKCAMTIKGCDDLRRMLAAEDRGMKEMIITKVTADLPNLMVHETGFKFAKAVFNSCDEQQMSRVLQSVVVGNELGFVHICNNYYGREAVKALIENLKIEAQLLTVTYVLEDNICSFTNYRNGQHVLEFFIYACNDDFSRRRIFNAMATNCVAIATNRLGCIVLQHCICPVYTNGGFIPYLLDRIVINSLVLAEDKYGNYLVQHVVDARIEDVTRCIVGRLAGRFSELARSKTGSNVVEKCLEKGEQREVVKIVVELTNSTELLSIAQDPFGNYVLQCALEQALTRGNGEVYGNLVKGINVHASILQTHLYGRTVMQKIHKLNYRFSFMNKFYRAK